MTQQVAESVTGVPFSESQRWLLSRVSVEGTLPIDMVSDRLEDVKTLIAACRLALVVTAYPWGVDFALKGVSTCATAQGGE